MSDNRSVSKSPDARASLWRQPLNWINVVVLLLLVSGYSGADPGQTAQIADLEKRIAALEAKVEKSAHKISAPFTVVDSGGKPIFEVPGVEKRGITIYNTNEIPVFELYAERGGSVFLLRDDTADTSIAIGATSALEPAIKVRTNNVLRAYMGSSADGHGRISVYGQDGTSLAAGLESQPNWMGRVAAYIRGNLPVAYLAESEKHPGGGDVITADATGSKVFAAGSMGDGNGAACIMKKGAPTCLGVALPGMLGVPSH